jgi:hypothetical protein
VIQRFRATTDQIASTRPKWPSPLKEAEDRPQSARKGEQQHEPKTTSFQRVAHEHYRDGEEAEGGKEIHAPSLAGCKAHAVRQKNRQMAVLGDDARNSASGPADPRRL